MSKSLSQNIAHFGPAHHLLAVFVARPEFGTSPDDMLVPSYWMHVARKLQPGAIIKAMPEGLPWIGEFVVIDCDEYKASVKLVSFKDLTEVQTKKDKIGEFKIERQNRWVRVVRNSDMKVVRGNFTSEAEAQKWLAENTEA